MTKIPPEEGRGQNTGDILLFLLCEFYLYIYTYLQEGVEVCRTDLLHAVADDGTDGILQHFKLLINHVRPQTNEEVQQVGGAAEVVGGNGLGHLVLLHCLS